MFCLEMSRILYDYVYVYIIIRDIYMPFSFINIYYFFVCERSSRILFY